MALFTGYSWVRKFLFLSMVANIIRGGVLVMMLQVGYEVFPGLGTSHYVLRRFLVRGS